MQAVLIAICGVTVLMNSTAYGQPDTQAIDQRPMNQEDWIERSFDRGSLNPSEAAQVDRKSERNDRRENRANVDGVLKRKEAARTGAVKHHAPRPIVRERPARQGAAPR
jgi:hypothetical protein